MSHDSKPDGLGISRVMKANSGVLQCRKPYQIPGGSPEDVTLTESGVLERVMIKEVTIEGKSIREYPLKAIIQWF